MHKYEIDTDKVKLFEENRRLGGFTIKVMDEWGQKIKKRFIKPEEKEQYIKEFGHVIIKDIDFFDWWCKINRLGKYDSHKKR
jgi:hypothetical protein